MAKLGPPLQEAGRLSLRGVYYVRTWKGIPIAQAWPRSRPLVRTAAQRQRERNFAETVWVNRYTDAQLVSDAIDMFAGSQILWRDALTAQLYCTGIDPTPDGAPQLYSLRFIALLRRALDKLGANTARTFVRFADCWTSISPGATGTRLTSQGPGNIPTWS